MRGTIIDYASKKKKKLQKEKKLYKKKIDAAEKEEHSSYNNIAETDRLAELRAELEDIREGKLRGSLTRSRAQYVDFNEKTSKFFLNLENKNFVSKHIHELKTGTTSINKPQEILKEMHSFYHNLYKRKPIANIIDAQNLV